MSKKKNLAYEIKNSVDKANQGGERPQETVVNIRTAPKRIKLPDNMMVFQAAAYLCAKELKPSTNRILMLFIAMSAYENFIGMDVKTISEELDMTERTVISALKELEQNNVIVKFKHPSDKRRHDYFINPQAAWKGNSYTRKKVLTNIDPDQLKLFPTPKKTK